MGKGPGIMILKTVVGTSANEANKGPDAMKTGSDRSFKVGIPSPLPLVILAVRRFEK